MSEQFIHSYIAFSFLNCYKILKPCLFLWVSWSVQAILDSVRESRQQAWKMEFLWRLNIKKKTKGITSAGRSPMSGRSIAKVKKRKEKEERSPVVRPERAGRPPNSHMEGRRTGQSLVVRPERANQPPDQRDAEGEIGTVVHLMLKNVHQTPIKPNNYLRRSFA